MKKRECATGLTGVYVVENTHTHCGGHPLQSVKLNKCMFTAKEMTKHKVNLVDMKMKHLKEELTSRSAPKSGLKSDLQLRLRALIVSKYMNKS